MHPWARPARSIPLEELWDRHGTILGARPLRWVSAHDVAVLLRAGEVQFVVVDVGMPLRWIEARNQFDFWKDEVRPRVADPAAGAWSIEDFPGEHFYRAQEWQDPRDPSAPVHVVLYHTH
jgi:hypothetical protein